MFAVGRLVQAAEVHLTRDRYEIVVLAGDIDVTRVAHHHVGLVVEDLLEAVELVLRQHALEYDMSRRASRVDSPLPVAALHVLDHIETAPATEHLQIERRMRKSIAFGDHETTKHEQC